MALLTNTNRDMKIYIASSWKNVHAVEMLTTLLRNRGHEVLSFVENNYGEAAAKVSIIFDEWVEEQVNLIQEYAKTYTSQQMPSEEEIEEHFSIEAHRVGFIPSEGYNRMQRHKIEGAKWVINQINKKQ